MQRFRVRVPRHWDFRTRWFEGQRSWILEDGVARPRRLGPKAPFNSPTNSLGRLNVVELTKVNWKFEREVTCFELRRRTFLGNEFFLEQELFYKMKVNYQHDNFKYEALISKQRENNIQDV